MNNGAQRVISIENVLKSREESGRVGTLKIAKTVVFTSNVSNYTH